MSLDATLIAAIDERLKDWNQGDVVIGDAIPFVHLADYTRPITSGSQKAAEADSENKAEKLGTVIIDVPGVVVITQSCDLVRSCEIQPFVKLAILQEVTRDFIDDVKKGQRPRYAYIPGVADRLLVGNLDAVSTVEKAVITATEPKSRVRGCRTDMEAREFALALSRNANRFAFPDDFSNAMKAIQARILKKHRTITHDMKGRPTNEGTLLTALREVRVVCSPSWTAAEPNLTFYFIVNYKAEIPPDGDIIVQTLLKSFKPTGPFSDPGFRLVTLSEMSAETYVSSQPLDLDHLSHAAGN